MGLRTMNEMKIAIISLRDLVKDKLYEVTGITKDLFGESYYQTKIGEKIVLYHISRFKPCVVVDDDEF